MPMINDIATSITTNANLTLHSYSLGRTCFIDTIKCLELDISTASKHVLRTTVKIKCPSMLTVFHSL